mmetsp:Transcript_15911/g.22663  ORF Transcript_15911/g.22663 Transcript_15911/m.22663 type:complete len:101 (+) Transcript_15911:59-361(+)
MVLICSRSVLCNTLLSLSFLQQDHTTDQSLAANYVRSEVKKVIENDPTVAGSILRLAFHDAVVRSKASRPSVGGADGENSVKMHQRNNVGITQLSFIALS